MDKDTRGEDVLTGDELASVLSRQGTKVFRYQSNRPGFIFLSVVAAVLVGIATFIHLDGLGTTLSIVMFSLVVTLALALTTLIGYWTYFARVHFLAVTADELVVGHSRRGYRIPFADLDPHKLGLDQLDSSPTNGILTVQTAKTEVRLHLFNPYAYVENLEGFMFHVLTRLNEHSDE
jgi:hypothetical protein